MLDAADRERLVGVMDNGAVFAARVADGRIADNAAVGELAAAFGIESGLRKRHLEAVFAGRAAGDDGVEFFYIRKPVVQFVHLVHENVLFASGV